MALFGEQYGSEVRMIQVGETSLELCGGTHVGYTGEIGIFKLISEGSVAAGVRRIEAVVGHEALTYLQNQERVLKVLQGKLQTQADELPGHVDRLIEENRKLAREISQIKKQNVLGALDSLLGQAEKIADASLLVAEVEAEDAEDLRALGDSLRDHLEPAAILLAAKSEGKVLFLSMVSKSLVSRGVHAGQVVKEAAQICGGGGGGRPDMAQAGGRLPDKLSEALVASSEKFKKQLEGIN